MQMKIYLNFFSNIPFRHLKYITTHLKPNPVKGRVGFVEIQAFEYTAYFQFLKSAEFCLIFISFIYIDPEQQ